MRTQSPRSRRCGAAALALALAGAAGPGRAEEPPAQGWRLAPSPGWTHGDHRIDLGAVTRWRWENWRAFTTDASNMVGGRTRLSLRYAWADRTRLLVEGQLAYVGGLTSDSSGLAATYRAFTPGGDEKQVAGLGLRQLWLEQRFGDRGSLRIGRQPFQAGTAVVDEDPAWRYLQLDRLAQRLVGTVGWSNVERSFDGASGAADLGALHADLYVGRPTTGVFDVRDGYRGNRHVIVGGTELTARRGLVAPDTQLGGFFVGYSDDRDPDDVPGLFGELRVFTLGASMLGVHPLGPGSLDLLLWGAGQVGTYADATPSGVRDLDQRAFALLAEVGYRLRGLPASPWLRSGVNFASGDGNPGDGEHRTFFNVLPTNHPYYGFADQLALQNLVDWFVQLRLSPLPRLDVDLFVHRFWLHQDDDARYFGSGAFARDHFGFASSASGGSRDVGTELDVVFAWAIGAHATFQAGFSYLWGGDVFAAAASRDVRWGFAQVEIRY